MKKKSILLLAMVSLTTPLLSGCLFGSGTQRATSSEAATGSSSHSTSNSISHEGTAPKLIKDADDQFATIKNSNSTRKFYKAVFGQAIFGFYNIGGYFGPLLVSLDPLDVAFYTDSDRKVASNATSFNVGDTTYYASSNEYFLKGSLTKTNDGVYLCEATETIGAAKELIKAYGSIPSDDNLPESEKTVFSSLVNSDGESCTLSAGNWYRHVSAITIPKEFNNLPVTALDNSFSQNIQLKTLRFESRSKVTSIAGKAFSGCSALKFATIPDSVSDVGRDCFLGCSSELMIYCEAASRPSGYLEYAYGKGDDWSGSAKRVWWGMTDYFEEGDFVYGVQLDGNLSLSLYKGEETAITIPNAVQEKTIATIGHYSFSELKTLKSVTLPSHLLTIEWNAFSGCQALKTISVPVGVTSIGGKAFSGCSALKFATIPDSVSDVGRDCFLGCSSELMIYCEAASRPSGYLEYAYGKGDDWSGSAKRVWWGVTGYGTNDDYVYGVLLDGSVEISQYIGTDTDVVIPAIIDSKKVSAIGRYAFAGLTHLLSVVIPGDSASGITTIENSAFEGDILLKEVAIPKSVTSIGGKAFSGCSALKFATIPDSVSDVGRDCFLGCSSELMIYCEAASRPSGYLEYAYGKGDDWSGSAKRVWWGMTGYGVDDTWVYGIQLNGTASLSLLLKNDIADLTIPTRVGDASYLVSTIGRHACEGKTHVKTISLSTALSSIGDFAFAGCVLLTEAYIRKGTTTLGNSAFSGCTALVKAALPNSVQNVGYDCFRSCSSDLIIYCALSKAPSSYQTYAYGKGDNWYGSAKQIIYNSTYPES